MLGTFWLWGFASPMLLRRGFPAERLIAWGLPCSLLVLLAIVVLGERADWPLWALFCVSSTLVSLAQPAVAQALPSEAAGRALSAYNLVIFVGVFVVQWGIGIGVDFFKSLGWPPVLAFQSAFSVFGVCAVLSYVYFHWATRHNSA